MKAVIFIDVQNDFIDGTLGVDQNHEISERILNYAKNCSVNKDIVMFATRDTHFSNVYPSTLEGKKLPVLHCVANTNGWQLYGTLDKLVTHVVDKLTFGSSNLVKLLGAVPSVTSCEIDEIEICGFCTSICVISNALMLREAFPNTKITILENLCGDINPESHKAALAVAQNCQIEVGQI